MLSTGMIIDNKYEIISVIGQGGMSTVYCAAVRTTGKLWAVKEARLENDFDGVKRRCIMKEIEILKLFNYSYVPQNIRSKIPQIADVIDDGRYCLIVIMDYIQGVSLDKFLVQNGPFAETAVVSYMQQLCEVLSYLHSNQIIYCDVKPSNIMLRENGEIAIVDFGAAKKCEEAATDALNLGTAGFAAPEQYSDFGIADNRIDIFGIGMTMYALLTGKNPHNEPVQDTSVRKIRPDCSVTLDRIIQKCTNPNPQDRYQSCEELLFALKNYQKTDAKIQRRKNFKILSGISVLAVLAVCILWLKHMPADSPASVQPEPSSEPAPSPTHRYEVIRNPMTWNQAKSYCESLGGHLATVTSQEEQQELEKIISDLDQQNYFDATVTDHMILIGGYKQDGNWLWVTGEDWSYSNWGEKQPVPQESFNAAAFAPEWVSVSNTYTYPNFICEWD